MLADTTAFTDAVRAGDIEAAKEAYPISRRSWERIEPIAGLIEDIDTAVDAREDDYDGPTDPAFTGWHRLEYQLWTAEDVSEAAAFADQLDADLQTLADAAPELELPPGLLTVGAQELIEEVAAPDGKLSGEEDRYSGTDLYDFQANVEGSEALVELLAPALEEADPELLAEIRGQFADHLRPARRARQLRGRLRALLRGDAGAAGRVRRRPRCPRRIALAAERYARPGVSETGGTDGEHPAVLPRPRRDRRRRHRRHRLRRRRRPRRPTDRRRTGRDQRRHRCPGRLGRRAGAVPRRPPGRHRRTVLGCRRRRRSRRARRRPRRARSRCSRRSARRSNG